MRDYESEVLDQYDISVLGTRKMRGAFFCDTDEGTMLLKETFISDRRALFLYGLQSMLKDKGYKNMDFPVCNREGKLKSACPDGSYYMLKRWPEGRECDVKKESDLYLAAENLALLHKRLRECALCDTGGADFFIPAGRPLKEEFMRRSREIKKVREFIRSKAFKGAFEAVYLKGYEKMYDLARRAARRERDSCCDELYRKSVGQKVLAHGNYNYHNVIITSRGAATTNFERCRADVQARDFCYFLRKVMEKHGWDERLGRELICSYQKISVLSREEKEYIAVGLSYPEKFWKTADTYYHSNKAWVQGKSVEKLKAAIAQSEDRMAFLEHIFAFNL